MRVVWIQWVFFPILLNRDVNMLKYLAGSKTVERIKKKPLRGG